MRDRLHCRRIPIRLRLSRLSCALTYGPNDPSQAIAAGFLKRTRPDVVTLGNVCTSVTEGACDSVRGGAALGRQGCVHTADAVSRDRRHPALLAQAYDVASHPVAVIRKQSLVITVGDLACAVPQERLQLLRDLDRALGVLALALGNPQQTSAIINIA